MGRKKEFPTINSMELKSQNTICSMRPRRIATNANGTKNAYAVPFDIICSGVIRRSAPRAIQKLFVSKTVLSKIFMLFIRLF